MLDQTKYPIFLKNEEAGSSDENMFNMREALYLAQEMENSLGRSEVL